jgi:hypothetical protein
MLEKLHYCTEQQILDHEQSKHASFLVQQNGFGPTFFCRLPKSTAKPTPLLLIA